MRFAIVGAGAMGSLFGGLLSRCGEEVWLIDPWEQQIAALREGGLHIEDATGSLGVAEVTIAVRATTRPEEAGTADVVVFFVKGYNTGSAAASARPLVGPETVALTLQNGLGNVEELEKAFGRGRVIGGTTSCGATLLGPGRIRFAGRGPTVVGAADNPAAERARAVVAALRRAGFEAEFSADVHTLIWSKVLVNVGINALTALTGLKNGELLDHAETRDVLKAAVLEAAEVARAGGVILPWHDPVAHVEEVARRTAANRSSMLQDVDNHRRTEIDTINGAVVRAAEATGLDAPVNRVLTNLVKLKERGIPAG